MTDDFLYVEFQAWYRNFLVHQIKSYGKMDFTRSECYQMFIQQKQQKD